MSASLSSSSLAAAPVPSLRRALSMFTIAYTTASAAASSAPAASLSSSAFIVARTRTSGAFVAVSAADHCRRLSADHCESSIAATPMLGTGERQRRRRRQRPKQGQQRQRCRCGVGSIGAGSVCGKYGWQRHGSGVRDALGPLSAMPEGIDAAAVAAATTTALTPSAALASVTSLPSSFSSEMPSFSTSSLSSSIPSINLAFLIEDIASMYSYALTNYELATETVTGGILCGVSDVMAQRREKGGAAAVADANDGNEGAISSSSSSPSSSSSLASNRYNDIVRQKLRRINLERTKIFVIKGIGTAILWSFWYNVADGMSLSITQSLTSYYSHQAVEASTAAAAAAAATNTAVPMAAAAAAAGGGNANHMYALVGDSSVESFIRTMVSILLEQFLWCPIVYSIWDIPLPALLGGAPVKAVPNLVRSKLGGLLVANAKVWTVANLVIYNLPLEWRVVVSSVADLFWQTIVSSAVAFEAPSGVDNGDGDVVGVGVGGKNGMDGSGDDNIESSDRAVGMVVEREMEPINAT